MWNFIRVKFQFGALNPFHRLSFHFVSTLLLLSIASYDFLSTLSLLQLETLLESDKESSQADRDSFMEKLAEVSFVADSLNNLPQGFF